MGALDRQTWSGPFTPIDRASPSKRIVTVTVILTVKNLEEAKTLMIL